MATAVHEHFGSPLHHHDANAAAHEFRELERAHQAEVALQRKHRAWFYAGGRLGIAAVFLVSAIAKSFNFRDTSLAMIDLGMTDTDLLLSLAIFIELAGGVMLAVGLKSRIAAGVLMGYLAMVTLLLNHDLSIELNRYMALCNLGFIGTLAMVVGHGSGTLSLDKLIARRNRKHI